MNFDERYKKSTNEFIYGSFLAIARFHIEK